MDNETKSRIAYTIVALGVLIAGFFGGRYSIPDYVPAEPLEIQTMVEGDTNFTNVVASGDITAGDDLSVGDDATVTGDLTVSGSTSTAGLLYPSFADETITDGETLTPTVTVYNLDSGGAVTMTLAACSTDGQPLILVGDDANNILIADTNVRTNDGGTQTIGQYDMITWICIDTEWVELSESNNS